MRKSSFRPIQLYRNSLPIPRACFVHEASARRAALYLAWYHSFPRDVFQLVERETGRVIGSGYRSTTSGVLLVPAKGAAR